MVAARVYVEDNQLDKAAAAAEARRRPARRTSGCAPWRSSASRACSRRMGKYDVALATLGTKTLGEQEAARLEVRGDVLLDKGDPQRRAGRVRSGAQAAARAG